MYSALTSSMISSSFLEILISMSDMNEQSQFGWIKASGHPSVQRFSHIHSLTISDYGPLKS